MTQTLKCVDCGKQIHQYKPPMACTCPNCKDKRCLACMGKHLDAKVCAYGKADSIPVSIGGRFV